MTNRDWAVLGFRLVGFYMATRLAMLVAELLFRRVVEGPDIAAAVTYAVMIAAVWGWADWLASWVFPSASTADLTPEGRSDEQVLVTALSIMGAYVITEALPNVVSTVGALVCTGSLGRSVFGGTDPSDVIVAWRIMKKSDAVAGVVNLLCGVVLLFYPNRIAAMVVALRRDGLDVEPEADEVAQRDDDQA